MRIFLSLDDYFIWVSCTGKTYVMFFFLEYVLMCFGKFFFWEEIFTHVSSSLYMFHLQLDCKISSFEFSDGKRKIEISRVMMTIVSSPRKSSWKLMLWRHLMRNFVGNKVIYCMTEGQIFYKCNTHVLHEIFKIKYYAFKIVNFIFPQLNTWLFINKLNE